MIDISGKEITGREAVVEGKILLKSEVLLAIKENRVPKGNVLEAAKLSGMLAAKKTPELIAHCHPIALEHIEINFSLGKNEIKTITTVKGRTKTGVEMEAFAATAVSLLTIYDMCKSLDRGATISGIRLLKKTGGKSGTYQR